MRENWDEFMSECCENQRAAYMKTEAGRQRRAIDLANYERLEHKLTSDQQAMVDAIMFERYVALEQEGKRLYEQGMKDGIWLVQKLGVLGWGV